MILPTYAKNALIFVVCSILGAQVAPIMPMQKVVEPNGQIRDELPIGFTEEEWARRSEIQTQVQLTDPPTGPVRNISEFERMQGVLIRYPLGIPVDLVRQFADDVTVYCLVSSSQQSAAASAFQAAGANMDNVEFIPGATDSYWTRDYGPWWVVDGNETVSVMDFTYNRPRPNDNQAPTKVANFLSTTYFAMDLIHTGGNYMTDSYGISASSDLVETENSTLTYAQILSEMNQYCGIDTYHVVPDPNNTYIDHIDCWGKYLAPDKVLIRSVPTSHPQFDDIEATADYFATHNSPYGRPYTVVRVNTPDNEPYTNSLILNDKIYVPMMPGDTDNNSAAIATYQDACPGYTIVPVDPVLGTPWESTDALHCRAKGIPDLGMLEILHIPPPDPELPDTLNLTARIRALSGAGLIDDSIKVDWKTEFHREYTSKMAAILSAPDSFIVEIPPFPAATELVYHWVAADSSGRRETMPFAGDYSVSVPGILESGDVSMDGILDLSDILHIFDAIADPTTAQDYESILADFDGNGIVETLDGVLLLNQLMAP